jgi:hypothetical protein
MERTACAVRSKHDGFPIIARKNGSREALKPSGQCDRE